MGEFSPVGNRKMEDMGMDKKDIVDIATVIIVALCCPFAMLLPPFNEVLKEGKEENSSNIGTTSQPNCGTK